MGDYESTESLETKGMENRTCYPSQTLLCKTPSGCSRVRLGRRSEKAFFPDDGLEKGSSFLGTEGTSLGTSPKDIIELQENKKKTKHSTPLGEGQQNRD